MQIAPTHVVSISTFCYSSVGVTTVVAHETPSHEAGDCVADGPPYGHESDEPGVGTREELQEVRGVQDVVTSSGSRIDRIPKVKSAEKLSRNGSTDMAEKDM